MGVGLAKAPGVQSSFRSAGIVTMIGVQRRSKGNFPMYSGATCCQLFWSPILSSFLCVLGLPCFSSQVFLFYFFWCVCVCFPPCPKDHRGVGQRHMRIEEMFGNEESKRDRREKGRSPCKDRMKSFHASGWQVFTLGPEGGAGTSLCGGLANFSRAAKWGGFKRGGFPIWTFLSFFVLFWDFPDFSGIFPICSGMVRGFSRFVLFLFLGLLRAPTRNSPEGVHDTIWTFPEKSGKHPGLETPQFSFSQIS